jgi:methylglutaconyl-CoA hydratase
MNMTTLEIETRNAISWIWMARPDRHNAFDEVLIAELTELLKSLDKDSSVRAIVLAGKGKSFSAGADLNWMKRQGAASMEDNLADALRLAELFRTLSECSKPTVARVHGAAMGGGMGLAAACDICIASTQAVFATSEVRLGLAPGVISPYVVRAIGERNAYRYFQTAERIDGVQAKDIGLAHEVVEPAMLDEAVDAILATLVCGGPQAQAASTDLIRAVANRPVTQELVEDCARRIAKLRASPEAQQGLTAFLEKKTPTWGGR